MGALKLTDQDFTYFRDLVEEIAGINLTEKKIELAQARLRPHISQHGFDSFDDYKEFLGTLDSQDPYWDEFINIFTTNKTDFFREPKHFDYLTDVILPEWIKNDLSTFKLWTCASSTGEEPYTLSMVLHEALEGTGRDYNILATDIDTKVLETASNGVYPIEKVVDVPEDFINIGFERGSEEISNWFRIKSEIKNKIIFTKHNLMDKSTPQNTGFDVVFCRNILIYFSKETCEYVLKKLYNATKKNGYLITSHSESLQGLDTPWKLVKPSIYIKK